MKQIKKAAVLALFWPILVGLFILETGVIPSSAAGWALLVVLGPVVYLVASAGAEYIAKHESKERLGLRTVGRVALLLLILTPMLAAGVYFTMR